MMAKFLIFRTDRIGDFITSQVVTNSISKISKKNQIDIVASKYNSKYIKNFKYINNIFIFDKTQNKILDFFNLFLQIKNKKYDYLIVLDGKRRSFLSGIFIKSTIKICFLKDFYPKFLISIFYSKYIKNTETNTQYKNFQILLNYLDIKSPKLIDYYENYKFIKNKFKLQKPYLHLHLDEKWFKDYYFHDFNYMNLRADSIYIFLHALIKKFKYNIVITQGFKKVKTMNEFKIKYFKNIEDPHMKITQKTVKFIEQCSFRDLENIVLNSKILICCEGAISHVSHSLNKKTIALIQKDRLTSTNFWIGHMNNIKTVFRNDIKKVTKDILKFNFI